MSYPTKNVTVRCHEQDAEAIRRAAERAGKNLTDYCRDILIPWAYSDLGERRPQLPPLERDRYTSMLEKAAKVAGIDAQTFAREAVERATAEALGYVAPKPSLPPERMINRKDSGMQPARSGTYAQDDNAVEVIRRRRKTG